METQNAVTLETPFIRFAISPENGSYEIIDKQANVTWLSNPYQQRFGEVTFNVSGQQQRVSLDRCEVRRSGDALEITFHPLADAPEAWLRLWVRPLADGKTLEFAYDHGYTYTVESVRLLDEALWVTDTEKGYVVVPVREGLLVPADSGLTFTHRFDTFAYEGCHMEILGVVKDGTAALVTWHDPYVAAELRSALPNADWAAGKQILSLSLILRQPGLRQEDRATASFRPSPFAFRLQLLGKGDYVSIAKAYRRMVSKRGRPSDGWLVTWAEKLKSNPERAKLFGAVNFKLWSTLSRQMNEDSAKEESVRLNWTFDEAAQIAEHLKHDLKLDKVLFIIGGWIRRGYDNQHPDILQAAPECGGNEGLADAAQRIQRLGYLFCLHDNYQDMYRDAPSWDESFLMKRPDGSLALGGRWAGGRAYLTCSKKAVELAKRPQNLPAVKQLTEANAYFIDTTYAAGLIECFDPNHPLSRWDDMKWKQAISDYARDVFGIFGSECGREWAIPHSDFFEGLTGVSGRHYHDAGLLNKLGGVVVPIFEVVYRDCIAMYGKYGYDFSKAAEYVLHHISIGRPLNYHSIPPHLYWKDWKEPGPKAEPQTSPESKTNAQLTGLTRDPALFTHADNGWAEGLHPVDRFVKNTYEILSPLYELTAQMPLTQHQFLTTDYKVQRTVFGEGANEVEVAVNAGAAEYRHQSKTGGEVLLPPYGFIIESPTFVAFHALSWNGLHYEAPPLFTLRSLDGEPLSRSRKARIYHGFGDMRLKLDEATWSVQKEAVVSR